MGKKESNTPKEIKGYEIVRLNIRDMQKEEAVFSMTRANLNANKITMRSSEIVRIVTTFNDENLRTDGSNYAYVKDLIMLDIGRSYNAYYKYLCEKCKADNNIGIFTLNIIEFDDNGKSEVVETIRYKRLLCGSSFIRNAKELYVREEMYDAVMRVLLTGIEPDSAYPHNKVAKYSTYLGLAATDSIPVSMPDICVVDDFHKKIRDSFDIIRQIKDGDAYKYHVENFEETQEETEEDVNCFDGAGIVSYEKACEWAKELKLVYVPASFQIRVLNGIKGNLYTFPVAEYIQHLKDNGYAENLIVKDLWGNEVNIEKKDVFLTKSQFKFSDMYGSFDE